MERKTTMHPRTISLFALLSAAVGNRVTPKIEDVAASSNYVNIHRAGSLRLYSMAFIEAPRGHGGYERVLSPFSIALYLDSDRVPVSYAWSSFSMSVSTSFEQKTRAFVAVLTYLLRRGMISEVTFHRSIERTATHPAADKILRLVEEFPQWAAHVLKTSPYLDYDASEAACAELLAYAAHSDTGAA